MKWEGNRQSGNVEDRRGQGGGGLGGMLGGRSIGIGTIVLALVGSMIFGVNPLTIINILSGGVGTAPVTQSAPAPAPPSSTRPASPASSRLRRCSRTAGFALTEEAFSVIQKPRKYSWESRKQDCIRGLPAEAAVLPEPVLRKS